jgi:hypothetical protein
LLSIISLGAVFCHAEAPTKVARVAISGRVVDEQSRGVRDVAVRGVAYTDVTEATTSIDGRFVLNVIQERVNQLAIIAEDPQGDRLGTYKTKPDDPGNAETSIKIQLAACRRLPVQVLDAKGKPAAGVRVGALIYYAPLVSTLTDADGNGVLKLPTDAEVQTLYATKPGEGFDYRVVKTPRDEAHKAEWLSKPPVRFQLADSQTVQIRLTDANNSPIAGTEVYLWLLNKPGEPDSFNVGYTPTEFRVATNEVGVAEFRGVPNWKVHPLTFWPSNDGYVRDRIEFDPQKSPDGRLTVKLNLLVPVTGRVRFADGRPAPGIHVDVAGAGYQPDGFHEIVTTDDDGKFSVRVPPDLLYMFAIRDEQWAAPAADGLIVRPNESVGALEFELRRATRVHGQVTVGSDEKPVAGQQMMLRHDGRDLHNLADVGLPNPGGNNRWVQPHIVHWVTTDKEGRYEFFSGPGKFVLSGPSQVKAEQFEVVDESELLFNFTAPRAETGPIAGRVVTGDPPRPVAGAIIEGKYRANVGRGDMRLRADEQGRFKGERLLHATVLRAMSQNGELSGIIQIGPDEQHTTIWIGPHAAAQARLIDSETREPLGNTKVQWGRRVHRGDDKAPWETAWGGTVTTDSAGRFEIGGLVVGQEYSLSVPRGDGTSGGLPSVTPETARPIDLGDLPLKPPYKPPTFEEKVNRELAANVAAGARHDDALKEAERLRQHVLVIFLERDVPLTEKWFKLRLDDQPVRAMLHNYQLIQLDIKSDGAAALAERLGVALGAELLPVWRFSDETGKELGTSPVPRLTNGEAVDRAAVLEELARNAPEPLDARELIKDALAEAVKTNRRVIVQETATWCGPCHLLARYLERQRSIWEKDYLWVRVDSRWHGSEEVMDRIKEGRRGGIPWYAIIDSNGKVLATSDGPDGNIGFPSDPPSIDHFLAMIKSTLQRISEQELATLRKGLESR